MNPEIRDRAFRRFIGKFDGGHYWEAHEVLEEIWKEERQDFYKGLIQIAASWVHLQRNHRAGLLKVLPRAVRYLEQYPLEHYGWDLERLIADCRRCLEHIRREHGENVSPERICIIRMADYYRKLLS